MPEPPQKGAGMPASKAQKATTAKRRAQAIALRLAGMDFETIAERLGYASRQAATRDFHRAIAAARLEERQAVENLREVEGQRLDRLQAAVWAKAVKGDLKAVETVLKVIAQRSRLLGLDAPVKTELTGPGGGPMQIGPVTAAELNKLVSIAGDGDQDSYAGIVDESDTEDGNPDADET